LFAEHVDGDQRGAAGWQALTYW